MGKRTDCSSKCGVMGCGLPNLHAGMHETIVISKRLRAEHNVSKKVCGKVQENTVEFKCRTSPSVDRNDTRVTISEIEIDLLKSRLKFLKKQIDEFCTLMNV